MALQRLAQKPLGRNEVSSFAEPELDRVAIAVDGSIEISLLASDFDVSLVHVPFPADASFAKIEALEQFRRVADDPSVNGRMIDRNAALGHHLLQVPQAQIVSQVPADAEQDHRPIKMPALEHRILHYCDQGLSS